MKLAANLPRPSTYFLALCLGASLFLMYTYFDLYGPWSDARPSIPTLRMVLAISLYALVLFAGTLWITNTRLSRTERIQRWLIDSVNWNIERLKAHGLSGLPGIGEDNDGAENCSRWPWGDHHTEYLAHLEAAARKWWILYDPSDPTTAPTNEMVSDWLQSERDLSREKARAIASMLRPDGLPTGPRK